jgi:hypothetical protein
MNESRIFPEFCVANALPWAPLPPNEGESFGAMAIAR